MNATSPRNFQLHIQSSVTVPRFIRRPCDPAIVSFALQWSTFALCGRLSRVQKWLLRVHRSGSPAERPEGYWWESRWTPLRLGVAGIAFRGRVIEGPSRTSAVASTARSHRYMLITSILCNEGKSPKIVHQRTGSTAGFFREKIFSILFMIEGGGPQGRHRG